MAPVSTPWYVVRNIYAVLMGLFLAALFVQVYLAGRMIFGVDADSGHQGLGWMLAHGVGIFPFLLAFFARGGKKVWVTNIVWGVLLFVLPILAGMMYVEPGSTDTVTAVERNIAAFHPVVAVIVVFGAMYLTWQAILLAAEGRISTTAPRAPRAPQARA